MKLKPYPKYKDSGIEWLGEIPIHWSIRKLKFVSSVKLSGVDKKTLDGELQVKLCNYTDVYKNEFISEELDFMEATATKNEIAKSTLNKGDVLITKDSETPDDIAVPAYVKSEFRNVLCGYHLAQIRANPKYAFGEYLFRLFCAQGIREQFTPLTNGITRYGLSKYSIDNSIFPVPKIAEQKIISTYLDQETAKIDELIKKNETLIELLKEKRQAIISKAVTKGLDPNVKMKDSGIEWLGMIPEGWEVKKLKHFAAEKFKNGIFKKKEFYGSGIKLINVFDVYRQNFYIDFDSLDSIEVTKKEFQTYSVKAGDIVFVRSSLKLEGVGASACVPSLSEPIIFECHLVKLRAFSKIIPEYLINFLNSSVVRQRLIALANTVTMATIGQSTLTNLEVEIPPVSEQQAIVEFLKNETAKIDKLIIKIESQNEKLKESRQTLISNVVTGKIKVTD